MTRTIDDLVSAEVSGGPPMFFPQPEEPIHYNFDQGNPATETFPLDELAAIEADVRREIGGPSFDYFDADTGYEELVYGWRGLRGVLADRFAARDGVELDPMNVILTSGSVHGIALVARAFLDPGDVVLVEAATFPYAVRFFEAAGAEVVTVPVDSEGMRVDLLEQEIANLRAAGRRPKLIYTIPTFQLPTGTCMPLERRRQLVALAQRERIMVHEDNVYAQLRYDGEYLPTLFSLDDQGIVIQSDSFSKTVAPALRLGWVLGSEQAIAAVAAVRQDLGVNQFHARVMARYTESGQLDRHIEQIREVYRAKRDTAVKALREYCGAWVDFEVPQGSFFLWLRISEQVDWELAAKKVAEEGVFCRPGERFSGDASGQRYLRMAYSNVSTDIIAQGVEALGRALDAGARR
ncbi:PLP-dependent aminotransferase family protein [Nocardioides marmoriginsengisoli]|uniref:PLP-dependent aminotransferase family protein n=1 Tax=Nocardioides marmoriginsengisoli TaxID=661483 RepID=A0A3N0CGK8_9ACTN|nr:PLP-dependent aminotransferase family protein [Nocardioides marmoriginsengisoli]RNL62449.1 PLP-dependent aminotransferase family protein [Nocardioides marmoriginsengisoli]